MSPLVDDLVVEVLIRLPPQDPASLVRAALVCRRWHDLVTNPSFSRRFREFHRSAPMLGMVCNRDDVHVARFVPTAAFCSPEADLGHWGALDARHGRVLFRGGKGRHRDIHGCVLFCGGKGHDRDILVVWDPITDEEWELPCPPPHSMSTVASWAAAVLCADAGAATGAAGACDHLDCHRGPFVVVLVVSVLLGGPDPGHTFICTYTSKTAAWSSAPISNKVPRFPFFSIGSVLVGNVLYFMEALGRGVLKYNLELQEISWILLPSSLPHGRHPQSSVLLATENGELGLATKQGSKLCIWWLRKQDGCTVVGDEEWQKPSRGIKLKKLLPADAALSKLDVVGSAEGVGIIFIRADDVIYMIDLKTCKLKKVYQGKINNVIPYMSFYTPALEAACTCM